MITFVSGNILCSPAKCLINTVNCEGYMGKGIAYQFKLAYPQNNEAYLKCCRSGQLTPGKLFVFSENEKVIINFPTKNHWREKSRISYVIDGMQEVVKYLQNHREIDSIAIPPLGCGNGGLLWHDVKDIILKAIIPVRSKVAVYIYQPGDFNHARVVKKPPKARLSHLVLMQFKLTLKKWDKMRLQKTAYFFNYYAGEEYFHFEKHLYGPYDHDIDILSREIKEMQSYYHVETGECLDLCRKQIISQKNERKERKFKEPIERAVKFVNAIDSDTDLELLASLCFLLESGPLSGEKLIEKLHAWNGRKAKLFDRDSIQKALQLLENENMISRDLIDMYQINLLQKRK